MGVREDNPYSFNYKSSTDPWGLDRDMAGFADVVEEQSQGAPLVSDHLRAVLENVLSVWLCSIVSYVDVVDNIITIIVFARQGFKDTINISMTSLSVWDLIRCVSNCVFRLYPAIRHFDVPLSVSYYHITGTSFVYLFFFSTHVSGALAAYVAVERCLCVSKPFTVRFLLTPRVVTAVNVLVSVIVFGSCSVNFSQYHIRWVFEPDFNATVAYRLHSDLYLPELEVFYNVNNILWPFLAFVVILGCTCVIAYYLVKASLFRSTVTSGLDKPVAAGAIGGGAAAAAGGGGRGGGGGGSGVGGSDNQPMNSKSSSSSTRQPQLSTRDKKVIKMLLVILVVYIVNLIPRLGRYLAKLFVPEFKFAGRYNNVFFVVTYFMYLIDLVNAAINPFIFFVMSSQFKASIKSLFSSKVAKRKTTGSLKKK